MSATSAGDRCDAGRGELVLVPRRMLLVLLLGHHPAVDEAAQPVGEDRPGDAEVGLVLVEAAHATQRGADDEDAPSVAHELQRAFQRGGLVRLLPAMPCGLTVPLAVGLGVGSGSKLTALGF